jgi:hypothetical protein
MNSADRALRLVLAILALAMALLQMTLRNGCLWVLKWVSAGYFSLSIIA